MMKKLLTIFTVLFLVNSGKAQLLENNIPSNASFVATFNSDKIFKLMPVKDFDKSFAGKKLLAEANKETNHTYSSIEDFGINLRENMYFFMLPTDSINYTCFYVPLADAQKFSGLLNVSKEEVTVKGNVSTYILKDSTGMLTWDAQKLLFVSGSLNQGFFSKQENAERYGIVNLSYLFDDLREDVEWAEEMAVTLDTTIVNDPNEPWEDSEEIMDEEEDEYSEYDSLYDANNAIKRKLQISWMQAQSEIVSAGTFESISKNANYQSSINKEAVASFWAPDLQKIQSGMTAGFGGMPYGGINAFGGYQSLIMDVLLDDKAMRMESKVTMDEASASSYKKISNKKLNRKFLKYVNSDEAIGFFSTAVNTQAYLEEFPKLMQQTYGGYLGQEYGDVIGLGADFLSLILDEKAIAKVAKGDALFVVNGITSKEVTYMGYDYDEDYNATEVLKTKMETLPSFLFMFSSDDMRLFRKALSIGINKEIVTQENNIYTIKYSKSPMEFYVLMKDGIVFTGNSLEDIQKINSNQFRSSISKSHKKLLSESNFSFLLNPGNLSKKMPVEIYGSQEQADKIIDVAAGTGDVYMKSNRMKGNVASGEFIVEIPGGQENALKYIFSLLEKLAGQ